LDDDGRISFMGHCHDCKSDCTVSARALEDGIEIEGGAVYEFDERRFLKCDACFGKNRTLTNYQDCEVYARTVGYLRPIKQMSEGKQAEVHDRVMFNIEGE
jgi:anaerobic ribonucleoside-triphosphate reductase